MTYMRRYRKNERERIVYNLIKILASPVSMRFNANRCIDSIHVSLGFSLTVMAATLIVIYGRSSAILSAKEGKLGFICYICIW